MNPSLSVTRRLCGGTSARASYSYVTHQVIEKGGSREPITHEIRADSGKRGCGCQVLVVNVPATQPLEEGARPLFARSAALVLCPSCDTPPLEPDDSLSELL